MRASQKRRLGLAGVAAALAVGVFAADAAGDARVTLNGGALTVEVASGAGGSGANADHKFFVEPFKELVGGRDGWRVGGLELGAPAIKTFDSDCFGNSLFNDVVCNGPRTSVSITTRDGADVVSVADIQFNPVGGCIPGSFFNVATVSLGGGADDLFVNESSCSTGTIPAFGFPFRFVANGGNGNDSIRATKGPDTLNGGLDSDTLEGRSGDDTIFGGSQGDEIEGGPGLDRLRGDGGRDVLNSNDGERDLEVDCGPNDPGTFDVAVVDTGDVGGPAPGFLLGPVSVVRGCESVVARPIDDGPPGALLGRRLRIREDGLTRVRIACPRAARVRCRGRVSVSDPRHPARALASASYEIRLGARERVALRLTSAEHALLRRRGRALVTTREQGRSRIGPRGVLRTFGIARS